VRLAQIGSVIACAAAAMSLQTVASEAAAPAARRVENGNIVFAGRDIQSDNAWAVWQVVPRSTDGTRVSTWVDSPGQAIGSRGARFSADGTKVAYTHDVDIIVRDAANGAVLQVLEGKGLHSGQGLDWSPDGTQLVIMDQRVVRILDLATGAESTVFELSRNWDFLGEVSWSPDGRWITFSTDGLFENSIRMIRPDSTGLKRIAYQPTADGYHFDAPQWSPDSTRLAYLYGQYDVNTGVSTTELITVDKKGENPVHVSDIAGGPAAGHWFIDVAWSPDGRRIAALDFAQLAPTIETGQVRVYVADGSNRAWLTTVQRIDRLGTIDWGRKLP
jgi:Tol biopolymer transport system component